jgi:iron complex transport system substrate-binding protein
VTTIPRRPRLAVPLSALTTCLVLLVAGCGTDGGGDAPIPQSGRSDTGGDAAGAADFPAEVEAPNGTVVIDARPERIVSLSATATEMLYELGAGDQVVAVDDYSNHPAGAPMTDLSGFEPNVEAVATHDPDLVVVHYDGNDVVAGLERLDIPVVELPAATSLDQSYDQIAQLGAATGHVDEAADLVADMQAEIDELVDDVPDRARPLTYFHELDDQLHTATSQTFVGQVYELAGLTNVADPADDGSGYPQVSAELLFEADPDVIFLADGAGGASATTVAERPGWGELTAVRRGAVVELDPDIASRWGPRTVDFLRSVVDATAGVE